VSFTSSFIELTTTWSALYHATCLLCYCLLLSWKLLASALLQACSKCCTLKLPFRYFLLFVWCSLSRFWFFFLNSCRNWRRLFKLSLGFWLPKFCRIEHFSFRLKDFLAYFLMLLKSIYIELSSASFWTFSKLNIFILLYHLLLNWFIDRCLSLRLVSRFFLRHLSLKDRHEVLIPFDWDFLIWIEYLLSLRLSFDGFILHRFGRYRWRFLVCIFLLISSINDFGCLFFNLLF
jgi:hypothetical protein